MNEGVCMMWFNLKITLPAYFLKTSEKTDTKKL